MKQKKQPAPELNEQRIDDAVLALLYLNLYHCGVVWKGFDWDAMNRLHEKGLISDPVREAKSVGFSEDAEKQVPEKCSNKCSWLAKSESRSGGRITNARLPLFKECGSLHADGYFSAMECGPRWSSHVRRIRQQARAT